MKRHSEDYIVDDILYCHVCNKAKEKKFKLFGVEHKVVCRCECEIFISEEERKKRNLEEQKYRQMVEREVGILDSNLRKCNFDTVEMNSLLQLLKNYVENWEMMKKKSYGFFIYGEVGVGKTVAAACIANGVIDQGGSVFMTSFPKILNAGLDKTEVINRIRTADLVVIDDLGVERKSEYSLELMYYVIDERYRTGKPLIVTTNMTSDEARDIAKNGEYELKRVYDRILAMCIPFDYSPKTLPARKEITEARLQNFTNEVSKSDTKAEGAGECEQDTTEFDAYCTELGYDKSRLPYDAKDWVERYPLVWKVMVDNFFEDSIYEKTKAAEKESAFADTGTVNSTPVQKSTADVIQEMREFCRSSGIEFEED